MEYDDVMNAQRKKIYKLRKNALNGDRLDIDVDNMFYDLSRQCVERTQHGNYSDFELELLRLLGIVSPVDEDSFKSSTTDQLTQSVYESMLQQYQRKQEKIVQRTMPQIKEVYETMSDRYKNIVFPLSDGVREIQLIVNLQEAYESQGKLISKQFEKHILLGIIDNEWKEHLRKWTT